jgi:GT2 family glycosyltransferase
MYAEETDWQRRIRDAGWEIAFTPAVQVTHLGGASGAKEKARVNRHFFESLDRYEFKHHGATGLVLLRAAMVVGCLLRGVLWSVALVVSPARRSIAAAKIRKNFGLVVRQLTQWRVQTN